MQNIINIINSHNKEVADYDKNINKRVFEIEKKFARNFDINPSELMQTPKEVEFNSLKSFIDSNVPKFNLLVDSLAVYIDDKFASGSLVDLPRVVKEDLFKIFEVYNAIQKQIKDYLKGDYLTGSERNYITDKFKPIVRTLEGINIKIQDINDMLKQNREEFPIYNKYYVPIQNMISNINSSVVGVPLTVLQESTFEEEKKKLKYTQEIKSVIENNKKELVSILNEYINEYTRELIEPEREYIAGNSITDLRTIPEDVRKVFNNRFVSIKNITKKKLQKLLSKIKKDASNYKNDEMKLYENELEEIIELEIDSGANYVGNNSYENALEQFKASVNDLLSDKIGIIIGAGKRRLRKK